MESCYESDISESWSLIDINLNEESLTTTDSSFTMGKNHLSDLKNNTSRKLNQTQSQNFKQNEEAFDETKEFLPFLRLEDERNDSGDAESIEILDMDGNYRDSDIEQLDLSVIDHINITPYHSEDEDLLDGRVHSEFKSSGGSAVIRRTEARRDHQDSVHFVYSENAYESDKKKKIDKFNKANNPGFKNYGNNVANTILSLSVGVIFAGVACVAIGHFLGVQDSADSSVQLMETLKKLQVENAALQSSMVHLKEALLTLEMNPELKLSLNELNKVFCEGGRKINPSKMQRQTDLKNSAFPENCSSWNSIKWLSKFQSIVKKGTETESAEIIINGSGKHGCDQLYVLKERKEKETKFSEVSDLMLVLKKLIMVLKKIMNRLSSSPENVEVVHEKLSELKYNINHNINKLLQTARGTQHENKVPVSELDLKTIHCNPNNKINQNLENSETKVLYEFPQPQKYYYLETPLKQKSLNSKRKGSRNENFMDNKLPRKNLEKINVVRSKKKKKTKKPAFAEKFINRESHYVKHRLSSDSSNQSHFSYKKEEERNNKYERILKKIKSPKGKKVLSSKLKGKSDLNKKSAKFCSESQCFNLTGYWVFRWADGRKEFRRHQTLGNWQFDRAKGRQDVRNMELNDNWQFERAKARRELRNEGFGGSWEFKRTSV